MDPDLDLHLDSDLYPFGHAHLFRDADRHSDLEPDLDPNLDLHRHANLDPDLHAVGYTDLFRHTD